MHDAGSDSTATEAMRHESPHSCFIFVSPDVAATTVIGADDKRPNGDRKSSELVQRQRDRGNFRYRRCTRLICAVRDKPTKSKLTSIPGIGATFTRDFARIGIENVAQLRGKSPSQLFAQLVTANQREGHRTSKNYLYVLRMATYFAEGGRDPKRLRWSAWSDAKVGVSKPRSSGRR
jgi:Pathogenicity locus